jgi:hypothetical protein
VLLNVFLVSSFSQALHRCMSIAASLLFLLDLAVAMSSPLLSQIADLVRRQKEMKMATKSIRSELKVKRKRNSRLKKKTAALSTEELVAILQERQSAAASEAAASSTSLPVSGSTASSSSLSHTADPPASSPTTEAADT